MASNRYEAMFARLAGRGEGAFVPFAVVGDPDLATSLEIAAALVEGGADALELGIPFSDPLADGPTIQAAALRALRAGATPAACLEAVGRIRRAHPGIPIGLLVYANLLEALGPDAFFARAAASGVDSVLVADLPAFEAGPWAARAEAHGVCPVLIAPPDAERERLAAIAALCRGYTYVVARAGVTGADRRLRLRHGALFAALREEGAPPPLLGFGVSAPDHVRAAIAAGARGAISGSAVVERGAAHLGDPAAMRAALVRFTREMKEGTRS